MNDSTLVIKNLVKICDKDLILKDVSFSLQKGTIDALLGASGSGKSTLLQIIGLLDSPDQGIIEMQGKNILTLSDSCKTAIRLNHIGFIYQFHHLLSELNTIENVMLPLWIRGAKSAKKQAQNILEFFGLKDRLYHHISCLSGGEKQRVAIARALINNPDILLADEPTGSLDSANAKNIIDYLIQALKLRGKSALIVTHNETIAQRADRVLLLEDGQIKL